MSDVERCCLLLTLALAAHASVKQCDSFAASAVPEWALLDAGNTTEDFVRDTFKQYSAKKVDSIQCLTKHILVTVQKIPSDPIIGRFSDSVYNYMVSKQMGLPRPVKVGDRLVSVYPLAGGWAPNGTTPDPFASIQDDLVAGTPGHPDNTPSGNVTCENSTSRVDVAGMRCAACAVPSTCVSGMGCFEYFAVECHFDIGSAEDAANLMVCTFPEGGGSGVGCGPATTTTPPLNGTSLPPLDGTFRMRMPLAFAATALSIFVHSI